MNLISVDQIYRKIRVGEYKTAIIYDRHFNNIPNNLAYFERYDCETIEELETNMKDFVSEYSGMFSIVMKKAKGGNIATSCLCRVNLTGTGSQEIQAVQNSPSADPEKMKQTLLAEIKQEMQLEMIKAENAMYKTRLAELDTTSGRMGLMIENFIMAKMGKSAPMFQEGAQLQGTVNVQNDDDSEISDDDFAQALIKIKDKFGAQNLVKIAERIEQNDPTINMIINSLQNG